MQIATRAQSEPLSEGLTLLALYGPFFSGDAVVRLPIEEQIEMRAVYAGGFAAVGQLWDEHESYLRAEAARRRAMPGWGGHFYAQGCAIEASRHARRHR